MLVNVESSAERQILWLAREFWLPFSNISHSDVSKELRLSRAVVCRLIYHA